MASFVIASHPLPLYRISGLSPSNLASICVGIRQGLHQNFLLSHLRSFSVAVATGFPLSEDLKPGGSVTVEL